MIDKLKKERVNDGRTVIKVDRLTDIQILIYVTNSLASILYENWNVVERLFTTCHRLSLIKHSFPFSFSRIDVIYSYFSLKYVLLNFSVVNNWERDIRAAHIHTHIHIIENIYGITWAIWQNHYGYRFLILYVKLIYCCSVLWKAIAEL